MSDLQSQINLLNDYIRTLQKQTQSKTNQIRTLTDQNDNLIQQCQSLRSNKVRQSTVITSSTNSSNGALQSTIQRLESQLKQSKAAYTLLIEQSQTGNETQRLRQDVRRLTQQKLILQQYKQKLQKQLRQIGFKSVDSYISKMKELQYSIEQSGRKIKTYETRIVEYERKVTLLSSEVTIKNSQIQRLNDKVRSITETSSSNNVSNKSYQIKINQYETKISQLTSQITITRSQIQRLKEKESQLIIIQRENENYRRESESYKRQIDNYKRQIQTLNVKISSYSSNNIQINSYQTTISSLQNDKKQWQRQKQSYLIKISDIQTKIVQKQNIIAQLRLRDDYLKTKQTSDGVKDKQIQNLNNIIRMLKVQIQDHKRTISFRDSTIKGLQSKLSSIQYAKSSQASTIQRLVEQKNIQINRLIQSHNQKITNLSLQIQRYKSISIVNSQTGQQLNSLRDQNNFLKRQSQNNQLLIQQLQRQKQNLKLRIRDLEDQRSRINTSQVKTFITKNDNSQTELTRIVRQLRMELDDVKKSNAVIHDENHKMHQYLTEISQSQLQIPYFGNQASIVRYHSPQNATSFHQQVFNSPSQLRINMGNQSYLRQSKHYQQQPYFKSQMNIEKKRQQRMDRSIVSPTRDIKQVPNNKQKWQSLQRKISALRVQNDQLKRTLLYQ